MLQNRDDARDDFLIGAAFRPQNLQPPRESKYITTLHIVPLGRFPTAKLAAHGRDGRSLKALGRRPVGTHAAPWCQCQRSVAIGRAPLPSTVKPGHRLRRPVPFPRRVFGRRAGWRAAAVDQSPVCVGADSGELPRRIRTGSQNVVFWLWVARCLSTARGDRQRNGQASRRDCSPLLFRTGARRTSQLEGRGDAGAS